MTNFRHISGDERMLLDPKGERRFSKLPGLDDVYVVPVPEEPSDLKLTLDSGAEMTIPLPEPTEPQTEVFEA